MIKAGEVRGAAVAAPRSNPLTVVEAAVAGDDIQSIARSAADALGCTVAISLPAFGLATQWPAVGGATNGSAPSGGPDTLTAVSDYAGALSAGLAPALPPSIFHAAPVRLGPDVVGVVAALASVDAAIEPASWLEATAAAAAVTALMYDSAGTDPSSARRAFLQMLELHAPADTDAVLAQARRLGYDLSQGAVGFSAHFGDGSATVTSVSSELPEALLAEVGAGRLLGLLPLAGLDPALDAEQLLALPGLAPLPMARSTLRRDPQDLRAALLEAAVLIELIRDPRAALPAHEETYRLLVGVLIRDREEVALLRSSTIAALEQYDELHDTELLATLDAFLAHHGSTTETAEAMSLHRHTVGYRLARVQEVSGLSPYESDGRERLSLGIKAHRILLADQRRAERFGTAA